MNWQVRHEGSPRTIDNLSLEEVRAGLADGLWEPTDEVRGPDDTIWRPLESHPATAETAEEVEPPQPQSHGDETHLDFNALIDVCLVLLIFFILTTSVAALQAHLDAPDVTGQGATGPLVVTPKDVQETMIVVTIKMENGKPVTRVEGKEVSGKQLGKELRKYLRPGKTAVLLDCDPDAPTSAFVAVKDAAKGVGVDGVFLPVEEKRTGSP